MSIIYCENYALRKKKKEKQLKKIKKQQWEISQGIKEAKLSPGGYEPPVNKRNCLVKDYFNVPGVYFLYRNNIVVYVGESKCIFGRIKQHIGNKVFDRFTYVIIGSEELRKVKERHFIKKHTPEYNIVHNSLLAKKVPFIKV